MKNRETFDFIKSKVLNVAVTSTTDKYGQIHISNYEVKSLFGDRLNEVQDWIKDNPGYFYISTYGGRYGTYRCITVNNNAVQREVSNAIRQNTNHLRNLNSW